MSYFIYLFHTYQFYHVVSVISVKRARASTYDLLRYIYKIELLLILLLLLLLLLLLIQNRYDNVFIVSTFDWT